MNLNPMKTPRHLVALACLAVLASACTPKNRSPEGSGMGSEWQQRQAPPADAVAPLSRPVQAMHLELPPEARAYRFLLTGYDKQRLNLRVSFDGKEVCRVVGRLDAKIHAHQYSEGPRVDSVCVAKGPVENEARVQVRLKGFTIDAGGVRTEVDQKIETDFTDFIDGWIELAEDGQVTISFPKC